MLRSRVVRVLLAAVGVAPLAMIACVGDDPMPASASAVDAATPDAPSSTGNDAGSGTSTDAGGGADTGPSCNVPIPADESPGVPVCPLDGGAFAQCAAGEWCCLDPGDHEYWVRTSVADDCIAGSEIHCNSPADCPSQQRCCITADVTNDCPAQIVPVTFGSSNEKLVPMACSTTCAGGKNVHVVCSTNDDCPQGQTCHAAQLPYDTTPTTMIVGVCY